MTVHTVYKILCRVSGKAYVGRTQDPARRRRDHFRSLAKGTHRNAHLQNAFNKHGRSQFVWVVIARDLSESAARDFEQFLIDGLWEWDSLFNLSKSAVGGGVKGRVASAETRARMSASRRVYLANPAVRANLSRKHTGKVLSPEHRQKLSIARRKTVERKKLAQMGVAA